jgi:phosphatidylinositol alpha 1,6-mannosyltransferase
MTNPSIRPAPGPAVSARPLRILIVSESPLSALNGVTTSVQQVARELTARGHQVTILCPPPVPADVQAAVHTTGYVTVQGFHVGVPSPHAVHRMIARTSADIVHLASPFGPLGEQAVLAATALGVPAVAVYQTDIPRYVRRFGCAMLPRFTGVALGTLLGEHAERIARARVAALHSQAAMTLVPSRSARDDLIGAGVDAQLIRHWGRGVDARRYRPDRRAAAAVQALHRRFAGPRDRPVVGYVGRLAPEKRVERLRVLRDLDVQVVVVGDGPSRDSVARSLGPDALLLGELRGEQLADAYAAFDLFAHTGTEETFGQTIQEAMATGLTVVAPRAGGPIDLVDDGVTGLLYSPEDDDELAADVHCLADAPDLRARFGRCGRSRVEARSWGVLSAQLLGYYRECLVTATARVSGRHAPEAGGPRRGLPG